MFLKPRWHVPVQNLVKYPPRVPRAKEYVSTIETIQQVRDIDPDYPTCTVLLKGRIVFEDPIKFQNSLLYPREEVVVQRTHSGDEIVPDNYIPEHNL